MPALPWTERVSMLSINPDAATRDDVAKLAAELMEARYMLNIMLNAKPSSLTEWKIAVGRKLPDL